MHKRIFYGITNQAGIRSNAILMESFRYGTPCLLTQHGWRELNTRYCFLAPHGTAQRSCVVTVNENQHFRVNTFSSTLPRKLNRRCKYTRLGQTRKGSSFWSSSFFFSFCCCCCCNLGFPTGKYVIQVYEGTTFPIYKVWWIKEASQIIPLCEKKAEFQSIQKFGLQLDIVS